MNEEAFVFAYLRPDGRWGVVNDREKRLIVTGYEVLAETFRVLLARRGMEVVPLKRNPLQVAELVMSEHVAAADISPHVQFIESSECDDAEDALWRAVELANGVPGDTVGDWNAAHADRPKQATA